MPANRTWPIGAAARVGGDVAVSTTTHTNTAAASRMRAHRNAMICREAGVGTVVLMSSLLVSRSVQVNAKAAAIFNLLADPSRHHELDGSGTVLSAAASAPKRLALGSKFTMSMRQGVPYRISNTVIEFEENRVIAWRHFGGHTWRYQLDPVGNGSQTLVTETFDGTVSRFPPTLLLMGAPKRNAAAIEATLKRLAARFE